MNFLSNKLHGLALCFAIAVPAAYLGKLFPIIGAPVFAIILGLLMAGIPRSDIFQGGHHLHFQKDPAIRDYFTRLRHESF